MWLLSKLTLLFFSRVVLSSLLDGRPHANVMRPPAIPRVHLPDAGLPVTRADGSILLPYQTIYYFDQLIDHDNPSLGTFKQRYWHSWEYYEHGGPIILSTPGESNAEGYEGYLTNRTINGRIAQQQNGSTIVLEHRFFGLSNPFPDLSENSLKYHTLHQAVEDLVYFAENVVLPMPKGDQMSPSQVPWILIGGSYSGALTSWTMVNNTGLFAAGYASSGVVQATLNYWRYFEPIRENMAQNCSSDVQAVVSYVDKVLTSSDAEAIQSLKVSFGLGNVTHPDDFAGALRNNLWDWQSLQPSSGSGAQFFLFCDALEVKDGLPAPAEGWGLEHAITAWSNYFKTHYYSIICPNIDAESCLGTYDTSQPYWTNTTVDNANRSWFWMVCNEFGYLQDGAPDGHPTLVTRLVQPDYDLRQCHQMFPKTFPVPLSVDAAEARVATTNHIYKGWDVQVEHLFFANGIRDPWREATLSASTHLVPSTDSQPIVLSNGFHCSDLGTISAMVDPTIGAVHTKALAAMKKWLAEWEPHQNEYSHDGHHIQSSSSAGILDLGLTHNLNSKPINAFAKDVGVF